VSAGGVLQQAVQGGAWAARCWRMWRLLCMPGLGLQALLLIGLHPRQDDWGVGVRLGLGGVGVRMGVCAATGKVNRHVGCCCPR
jgi:hypothetical protein